VKSKPTSLGIEVKDREGTISAIRSDLVVIAEGDRDGRNGRDVPVINDEHREEILICTRKPNKSS